MSITVAYLFEWPLFFEHGQSNNRTLVSQIPPLVSLWNFVGIIMFQLVAVHNINLTDDPSPHSLPHYIL